MANTLESVTTQIVFFGNKLLSILKPKLAFVGRIDTNQVQGSFFSAGDKITVPSLSVAGSMQKRAIDGAANILTASSGSQTITLEQGTMSIPFDNLISTFTNVAIADELAERLAVKAANYVDSLVAGIYADIPYAVGTLNGGAMFNSTDGVNALNLAVGQLSRNLAPTDRLRGLVGPTEATNLRGLAIFQQAQMAGGSDQRTTGRLGTYFGVDLYESQNTPTNITLNTTAEWGTPLVNTPVTAAAIGDETIAVDGLASTAAMKKGSIFTLGTDANGFAIPYSITANVTASSGAAVLSISPPLKTAPANNDALTPRSHSAAGSQGLVYDPSVVQLVIRPQVDLLGPSVITRTFKDPDSNLQFRLMIESNVAANPAAGAAYQNTITMDLLAGVGAPRPELACRLEGAS